MRFKIFDYQSVFVSAYNKNKSHFITSSGLTWVEGKKDEVASWKIGDITYTHKNKAKYFDIFYLLQHIVFVYTNAGVSVKC